MDKVTGYNNVAIGTSFPSGVSTEINLVAQTLHSLPVIVDFGPGELLLLSFKPLMIGTFLSPLFYMLNKYDFVSRPK